MAQMVLEIRTYRLTAGSEQAFHRVVAEQSVPLLRRFGIDVVRFGPSEQSEDGFVDYLLVRAFESHAAREEQEARFYGSSEWRSGPREEIVSRIESDHTVVFTLASAVVDALRAAAV
jgi:NIPSNAP